MDIEKTVQRTTQTREILELHADAIRTLLRNSGVDVPDNASVTFTVPGGGDWSGESIQVSKNHPVTVSWTTTTQE